MHKNDHKILFFIRNVYPILLGEFQYNIKRKELFSDAHLESLSLIIQVFREF